MSGTQIKWWKTR